VGGCFQFMNARFLAYAGASREAPLRSWMDAVHLEDAGEFAASYRAAVEAGAGYRTQVRLRRHDGEFHWFDVIGLPRFDGERLLGFLGCSIDVTEQRLAELQRSQLEAQRQVAAALREADRRKEEFLWRLSHELRNPLAPLANLVEMLRHPDPSRETLDMARDVLARQVEHLRRLVHERLDVALHGSQVVPAMQAPPSIHGEARSKRRALRILIVDDNVDYIDTLSDLLRARGHDVVTAADGPSALAAAARGTPDIVLLDLGLPGMDGVEVAERLRAERTCGNALLVAITVYGGQQEALRLACAGFHHHLVKPVDFEQIDALLAERG
jgi:PAS domain S-box-containing protein